MSRLKVAIIGCGRMGTTIDDEVKDHPFLGRCLPYSHAACYAATPETEMVACSDVVADKVEQTRRRYGIPRGYTDYREMVEKERPDIVSVTTRPGNHAEITVYAAEHGVRGIYCEKPLCCSMQEADTMLEACRRHGVKFNYGTNRRYTPCHVLIRQLVQDGEIGELRTVITFGAGSAQWSLTHASDLMLYMAGDPEVEHVQGMTSAEEADFADNRIDKDPSVLMGYVKFKNGVVGQLVACPGWDLEVVGTKGKLRTLNDQGSILFLRNVGKANLQRQVEPPPYPYESGGVSCIRDLIEAIRTGRETKGNIALACRSQEIILGWVESHRLGGQRVPLPMTNRSLHVGTF
ncbi:MAG: Gfo/Idh/MocA family oxidoreductase [Planctomycetes bacterium]|nr:Gfo/Idh/MocA family oxidoreductase [Planctomycetota bacterium]